jgi:hypothetical protein
MARRRAFQPCLAPLGAILVAGGKAALARGFDTRGTALKTTLVARSLVLVDGRLTLQSLSALLALFAAQGLQLLALLCAQFATLVAAQISVAQFLPLPGLQLAQLAAFLPLQLPLLLMLCGARLRLSLTPNLRTLRLAAFDSVLAAERALLDPLLPLLDPVLAAFGSARPPLGSGAPGSARRGCARRWCSVALRRGTLRCGHAGRGRSARRR